MHLMAYVHLKHHTNMVSKTILDFNPDVYFTKTVESVQKFGKCRKCGWDLKGAISSVEDHVYSCYDFKKPAKTPPNIVAETPLEILPNKIKLTETMEIPNITRKHNGIVETINGSVASSTPDENGVRWLSLYDVLSLFTGKSRNSVIKHYSRHAENITSGEIVENNSLMTSWHQTTPLKTSEELYIENNNVLVKFGGGAWKPTPAVKSVDLMKIGVKYNANIASMAANTQTRLIGGDLTLVEEVEANREMQETLAVEDPNNILRVAGELIEAENPEIATIAENARETIAAISGVNNNLPRIPFAKRFKMDIGTINEQEGLDFKGKQRFYIFEILEKAATSKLFIKIGISCDICSRFENFCRDFSFEHYELKLKKILQCNQAKLLETAILKHLRKLAILPSEKMAHSFISQNGEIKKVTEAFEATDNFNFEDLETLIENKCAQIGIPINAHPVSPITMSNERITLERIKFEAAERTQLIELVKEIGNRDLLFKLAEKLIEKI